jgi:hypothetical protein
MAPTRTKRALKVAVWLAMAVGLAGWVCMWFTEEAIWAPQQPHCATFAIIELKGRTYNTCSYLAARYRLGEGAFTVALLIMAVGFVAERRSKRDR